MKKLDVLMLKSFLGPFVLTTAVSNFILLIQYLLKYFDDFVGKNLGFSVFAELLFYFSLNMLQVALPLGVLVASLMTFGNLGENFELTAIKGSGISLIRVLRPIFLFVVVLSIGAYFFNNYTIPAANLKAYSLLYDIKHTKPALDIKEGAFYNGIPNYSIKVKEKFPDGKTLKDVIIYDHTAGKGNKTIILADSSIMYTIMDDRYLKLEMFNGNYYIEEPKSKSQVDQFYRTKYHKMDLVFSLASFDLKRRKEELFQNNRQMKNISELTHDIDSFSDVISQTKKNFVINSSRYFQYHDLAQPKGEVDGDKNDSLVNEAPKKLEASMSVLPLAWLFQKAPKQKQEMAVPNLTDWWPKKDTAYTALIADFEDMLAPQDTAKNDEVDDQEPLPQKTLVGKSEESKSKKSKRIRKGPVAVDQFSDDSRLAKLKSINKDRLPGKDRPSMDDEFDEEAEDVNSKPRPSGKSRIKLDLSKLDLDTMQLASIDLFTPENVERAIYSKALNKARNLKVSINSAKTRMYKLRKDANLYTIEKFKKYAQALACILMFMIGAPLGSIIKKGGLGVPTIVAIFFFIIYYVFTSVGEKSAKEGAMNPYFAVWMADLVLLPFGLFFLRQARIDARLFEMESYTIWFVRLKEKYFTKSDKP